MADDLTRTRESLHAVAELVLAGPQYRGSGTIRLRIVPGGFATVAEPALAVDGEHLVTPAGRIAIDGNTYAALAEAAGVEPGAPEGLYHDGTGASPDDTASVDPAVARHLTECFAIGDAAMRRFAPEATPVLWPEHFDLGITIDEVNYGISLGDAAIPEPYAYVGPHQARTGEFWNALFGAARPMRELPDPESVAGFFAAGRAAAG